MMKSFIECLSGKVFEKNTFEYRYTDRGMPILTELLKFYLFAVPVNLEQVNIELYKLLAYKTSYKKNPKDIKKWMFSERISNPSDIQKELKRYRNLPKYESATLKYTPEETYQKLNLLYSKLSKQIADDTFFDIELLMSD